MWEHVIGRLVCSLVLLAALSAHAADGNREVFSPWTSAPTCPSGKACIYMLASDGQLYVIDGSSVTTKLHGAKSFRTSSNCAGLSSPTNGDVCYDTTLGYFRLYSGGWRSVPLVATVPLSITGQTVALSYSSPLAVVGGSLTVSTGGSVYASITGAGKGVLGVATLYLVGPGVVASGTTEAYLLIAPRAGTARNLYCDLGTAPGGADTVVFTARLNAADQATTCTISAANTTCNDTSHTFAVVAGNRLSIKAVSSAGLASDAACSFEVTN
jgi:hypothetical protein